MSTFLQDLNQRFPIVDPKTGQPTDYFMRLLRGQTGALSDSVDEKADAGAIGDSGLTMATMRLLGRDTAGSGPIEELTLSEALDLIGSAAQGDILYRGASAWARLGAGTAGQFLKTLGAGANPSWASVAAGGQLTLIQDTTISSPVADVVSVSLAGYSRVVVQGISLTCSVNGQRAVHVSQNGGSSYLTAAGDYVSTDVNGVAANSGGIFPHATLATAARNFNLIIEGINSATAPASYFETTRGRTGHIAGQTAAINMLKVFPSAGGNFNAGRVVIWGA